MGTRSAIARPDAEHGFRGVYCHWDGYPTGVGAAIHAAVRFFGSAEKAAQWLVDDHPAGWSSLASADFTKPLRRDSGMPKEDDLCRICQQSYWRHYIQNYDGHGLPKPEPHTPGSYAAFDHNFEGYPDPGAGGPCPYPDSEKPEQPLYGDGDDWGTEYAYVITDTHLTILDRCHGDGGKAIGWFGMSAGDSGAFWRHVRDCPWSAPFDGAEIETAIRLHHELAKVATDAGLGDL